MGHGKETPRQKMIGMMYLVLTAMLALNVSAEVLEAFVLVDNGLNQTLKSFRSKNEDYYSLIAAADRNNEAKAKKWMDKSLILKAKSLELCKYIEEVKVKIVKTADGEKAEAISSTGVDGHKVENKSDTSVPANILLGPSENGEAYEIKKRIEKYKGEILGLIDEKDRFPVLVQTITRILDTQNPPLSKDGERRTWASIRFEGVPLISTLPLLSNMQVDVLNCEALLLDHFFKQIDAQDVRVNAFDVVVIPESSTILKGETFKANVMLAAYDKTQLPSISVNGAACKIEEGKGIYQAIGNSLGEKSLKCQVIVKGPDGTPQKYEKEYKYQVIQPMLTVSPTKMNVLYRGIDNPVELSVSGVPNENVLVDVTNGSIRKSGGGFLINPSAGHTCDVRVFAKIGTTKKLMGTSSFRVKQLPLPTPRLDGASSKTISKSVLRSSLGIRAEMPKDFDFDLRYTVRSFVITGRNRDGYDMSESSSSASFTGSQKNMLDNVTAGQRVFISEIKAVGPDGKVVELNDLVYKIK
jgi:gliding motility-associated protein GldM